MAPYERWKIIFKTVKRELIVLFFFLPRRPRQTFRISVPVFSLLHSAYHHLAQPPHPKHLATGARLRILLWLASGTWSPCWTVVQIGLFRKSGPKMKKTLKLRKDREITHITYNLPVLVWQKVCHNHSYHIVFQELTFSSNESFSSAYYA